MDWPAEVDVALRPFVRAIRIQGLDDEPSNPDPYIVLPGPFPVIGFRISGELRVIQDRSTTLLARSGLTGLQGGPRSYLPQSGTRSVLLALRPEGAFGLFGVPMSELINSEISLDQILPPEAVSIAEERVATAARSEEVEEAVVTLLKMAAARSRVSLHPAIVATSSAIVAQHGNVRIEELACAASISRRQLERLFQLQVGVPPKRLAALARFGWAAARLERAASAAQLAVRAGYADQAHFIRSFAQFAGAPPKRLLASTGNGSAVSQSFNP